MLRSATFVLVISLVTTGCGARTSLPDASPADAGGPNDAAVSSDTSPPADAADCHLFSPTVPIAIATVDVPFAVPVALRVVAPYVYFGFFITSGEQNGTGVIYRVPLVGGEVEPVEQTHYGYGPILNDSNHLFFPQYVHVDSSAYHAGVMARSLMDGTTFPLSNPVPLGGLITVSDLAAGPADGVFWLVHPDGGGTVLAFWDGTKSVALSELSTFAYTLAVTNDQVFLQSNDALYAVPTSGGEAKVQRPLDLGASLLGVSNGSVIFTPAGSTIVRRDSDGEETVLVQGANLLSRPYSGKVPAWVDEAWVTYAEADTMLRVPSAGGSQYVFTVPSGIVEAISGDACNLYWMETRSSEPGALMVRAIEP